MSKNYYIILGIESDATQEQIKSAYRAQVKNLHPDYYGEDSKPFRDLQEAYEVLSNPSQRRAYDQKLKDASQTRRAPPAYRAPEPLRPQNRAPVEPLIPTPSRARTIFHTAVEDIFTQLRQGFPPYLHHATQDIQVEVSLTAEQAYQGGQIQVMLPVRRKCPACWGYGRTELYICQHCKGQGYIQIKQPILVPYPSGVTQHTVIQANLAPLGLHNVDLNIHFNIYRSTH